MPHWFKLDPKELRDKTAAIGDKTVAKPAAKLSASTGDFFNIFLSPVRQIMTSLANVNEALQNGSQDFLRIVFRYETPVL